MDTLELCCTPTAEACEQVGTATYDPQRAMKECETFRAQLKRQFGEPPAGARLVITRNPHDFGTYYEVAVRFDEDNETTTNYAFKLESELPEHWDQQARQELDL